MQSVLSHPVKEANKEQDVLMKATSTLILHKILMAHFFHDLEIFFSWLNGS